MKYALLILIVLAGLVASGCIVTLNGADYDCLWTPEGVQCAPLHRTGRS